MKVRFSAHISKNFQTVKSMKIRPVEAELFDVFRHAEVHSHFSKCSEGAENIPDKTNVKPLPKTIHDSMGMVRFYSGIYQLPLRWPYNINRTEQSGINDNNRFKYIYVCVHMCVV
jgi:hypothetical protein